MNGSSANRVWDEWDTSITNTTHLRHTKKLILWMLMELIIIQQGYKNSNLRHD